MKYTKQEIIDLTKDAAMIETYVFTSDNHRIHTDNIKYVGTGTFDNQEIDNLPYKNGEVDVGIRIMSKEDYETTVLVNSSENWPEDLNDDDKIAVIIVNENGSQPPKMTWEEYKSSNQDTYLDDENTADQEVVYSDDVHEIRVFKAISHDESHVFSGEDEDFVIVESKYGADDSYLLYGCTLQEAINYVVGEEEEDEEPRKLYVLSNSIWSADDYLNGRNTDPLATDLYLFATKEEAIAKAQSLDVAHDIYNDCTLFTGEMDDEEILDITGYDSIEDFEEALAEPYSTNPNVKNYGEDEKTDVAKAIVEYPDEDEIIDAANYDFGKSLEGCILVFWSWQRYIGYARKCIEVRHANPEDTESLTTKQDKTFVTQCDILLTAKEVAEADDLQEAVREALSKPSWKWTNPNFVESQIENL